MSSNRYNNTRYNNRIRLINSYMSLLENMNREFSNMITVYRNSEQNLSRLIFEEFNENNENIDEESNSEEESLLNRTNTSFFLSPIRSYDYFNIRTRNNVRNININSNPPPNISIERSNSNTNENDLINTDFTNFMTPVIVRPTLEQINSSTTSSTFDSIENPMNSTCPISTVEFRNDDIVTKILYCGHVFLKIELENWFRSNTRCPMCRYDIRTYNSGSDNLV